MLSACACCAALGGNLVERGADCLRCAAGRRGGQLTVLAGQGQLRFEFVDGRRRGRGTACGRRDGEHGERSAARQHPSSVDDGPETWLGAQHCHILPLPRRRTVTPGDLAAITSYNTVLAYRWRLLVGIAEFLAPQG